MKDIWRAQCYQLKKDRLVILTFFLMLFVQITAMFGSIAGETEPITGSLYSIEGAEGCITYTLFFVFVIAARICGQDFMDKTGNYEIMSGHTRREIYIGRVIAVLFFGTVGAAILVALPEMIAIGILGWGNEVSMSCFVMRSALLLLPIFRILCEVCFLTFIIRNTYVVILIGMVYICYEEMMASMMRHFISFWTGMSNLYMLIDYDYFYTYTLKPRETEHLIFDSALPANTVVGTILVSIVAAAIFVYLGYIFFKHDDLN